MSTDRAARLRELFDAALEQAPNRRDAFLRSRCDDDEDLLVELLDLIEYAGDDQRDPLVQPIVAVARQLIDTSGDSPARRRIGAWQILEEIGQGGMGTVYRVTRSDTDYAQIAALKLIRGFPTHDAVARFRRERRLLATLDHPNIARLIDGGTTEEGQPYLVMSLIEGQPLVAWLRRERPGAERSASLVRTLCHAVHHAHQHLIVHRDLKPGNVLVGADDQPTLLDFGIAKLLADTGDATATAARVMTPAYASPEQRAGGAATTASDIYGLGLILFELLTGRAYRGVGADGREANTGEHALPAGDLGNVVRMALREEPSRRYPSAAAMADDIDRYFAGQPLVAAPDEWSYRARKFVVRHRTAVIAAAMLVALSAAFGWRLLQERDRALQAQQQAQQEAATASEVTDYLRGLFKLADPETAQGHEFTAREMLAKGEQQLTPAAIPDARVRARLLATVGEIYATIGDPKLSADNLRDAVTLMRVDASIDRALLARTLHDQGRALEIGGDFANAEFAVREALALRESATGPNSIEVALTLNLLGVVLQDRGRFDEAAAAYRRSLRILEPQAAGHPEELASTLHNLGWIAFQSAHYPEALSLLEQALKLKREQFGEDHPKVLSTLQILAQTRGKLGDFDQAQALFEDLLQRRRRVNGENSLLTLRAYNEVGSSLQDLGRYASAIGYYDRAIAIARQLAGGDSVDLATELNNRSTLDEDRGDVVAAEAGYREVLAMRLRLFGPEHPGVARVRHNLARLRLSQGDAVEAESLARLSAATRAALLPADNPERHDSALLLARIALARGDIDAAATALQALESVARNPATSPLRAARWYAGRAELAEAQGQLELAAQARSDQIAALRLVLAAGHPQVALAELASAQVAARRRDGALATQLAAQAQRAIETELAPTAASRRELAELLHPR